MTNKPLTYKDAGVDIDAGNELVERIKPLVKRTLRPEVLAGLGGFGGGLGGAALGATLIFAVAVALLTRLDSVPVVGEYVTNIINFVKDNSPASMLLPSTSPTPSAVETPIPESN